MEVLQTLIPDEFPTRSSPTETGIKLCTEYMKSQTKSREFYFFLLLSISYLANNDSPHLFLKRMNQ